MEMQDQYRDWASIYGRSGALTNIYPNERAFLRTILQRYGVKKALDCACGTGPHLVQLARMGWDVCGSDFSEAMLQICKRNLAQKKVQVITRQADYRCLEHAWNHHFDAILCMNQSIAHMHTRGDLLTAFRSIRGRLSDRGILIMTQGSTHHTLQDRYRFDLLVNNRDFSRIFVRDVEDGFQIFHFLDVYHGARRDEMKVHTIRLRIILDDEYRLLLGESGYSRVHIYGGFDMAPYDREQSRRLIVVAER